MKSVAESMKEVESKKSHLQEQVDQLNEDCARLKAQGTRRYDVFVIPVITRMCPCGETQTMSHIVESCPLTKLNGGLSRLHSADEDAFSWLTSYGK